jgi:hypothetical protein
VPEIAAEPVLAAARALALAGQSELGDRLLASVRTGDPSAAAALALARAHIAVEVRQWRGAGDPAPALRAAATLIAAAGEDGTAGEDAPAADAAAAAAADAAAAAAAAADGPARADDAAFDLELLQLFRDYWAELVPDDGTPPHFGPDGRDAAGLDELAGRAARLAATAPDRRRTARAAFYAGLIADNLRGEPDRAQELFTRALAACRPGADDDFAAEALRHLGGCAQAAGDLPLARQQWERSAELAQRSGWLLLALAQQALLAELTAEEGDQAGAGALAREVGRWAGALGLPRLQAQADAI